MKAIILSAGRGERLMPLTANLPKPMVQINSKPVLQYLIDLCKKYGVLDIGINTSYLPEKIESYFEDGKKFGINITYSHEKELLGTAGALINFKDFLKGEEDFLVIYGDAITDINLKEIVNYHLENNNFVTLAVREKKVQLPPFLPGSMLFVNDKQEITQFLEKPSLEECKKMVGKPYLSNSGIYVMNKEIFNYLPAGFSDFSKDIFPKMIRDKKKLGSFIMNKYFFREIGNLERYNKAKEELEIKKIKLNL